MKKIPLVLTSLLLVACASSPKPDTSKDAKPVDTTNGTAKLVASAVPEAPSAADTAKVNEAKSVASEATTTSENTRDNSVYFDFDSFAIPSAYRDVVIKQAEIIKNNQNKAVVLEGNTDERGSGEYNLALGNRRANSVQKNLVLMGIPAARIKLVSYGKGKPRLSCHEEKCWSENRRVDFVLKDK